MTDTATEITVETILENRRRWAEALRSGEYEQGYGYLCADGAYCCLGVACDILGRPVLDGYSTRIVPDEMGAGALGLVGEAGETAILDWSDHRVPLTDLNDTYGFTFDEIADLIDDGQVLLEVPGGVSA